MPKKVEIILKHQENRGVSDEELRAWVNSVTGADKFTPLHLASFKGNMDAIRILEKYGANIHALNGFGLNMLHVAAQGDVAPPLYYFKERGVDLNL